MPGFSIARLFGSEPVALRTLLVTLALAWSGGPRRACAQTGAAALADDIVILSKGSQAQEKARTESLLGAPPGTIESPYPAAPGTTESILEERPGPPGVLFPAHRRRDVLGAITHSRGPVFANPFQRPTAAPVLIPPSTPLPGSIEMPQGDDEGPLDGLTLDAAIDRLLKDNHDLHTKFLEIPQADADILSAGLRANPILFASADSAPYGSYSPRRPGANDYTVVWVQPFDINGKGRARTVVACQAKRVLEAQFQNEVRHQIDNLYTAFVDVLAAREAVRTTRAGLLGYAEILRTTQRLYEEGTLPHSEIDRIAIERETTALALDDAITTLRQAKQALAFLLNVPDTEADQLEVRGRVRDDRLPLPAPEELIRLALAHRPDLAAFRLGVARAEANVRLERAERFEDVFLLYTPWTFTNNGPIGEKNTTSWSLGGVVSLPMFNRNQGNIARARINVTQSRSELARLERLVTAEVRRAVLDYENTRNATERIRREIVPKARHLRDDKFRLYLSGQVDAVSYLAAQREFSNVVRQYQDAVIRHRRSALRINTTVGLRLLP